MSLQRPEELGQPEPLLRAPGLGKRPLTRKMPFDKKQHAAKQLENPSSVLSFSMPEIQNFLNSSIHLVFVSGRRASHTLEMQLSNR